MSSIYLISSLSIIILIAILGTNIFKTNTAKAAYGYQCNGQPFNAVTSDNVCHALAITTVSNLSAVIADFNTTSIVCSSCSQPGYYSNEIKMADNSNNWIEVGYMNGWYGQCGGAGTTINQNCYRATGYYWSDSRPQDAGWNFHYLRTLNPVAGTNDRNYTSDENNITAVDFSIEKNGLNSGQWDILITDLYTHMQLRDGGDSYAGRTVGGSTNNYYSPNSAQYGTFLSGLYGLDGNAVQFMNRQYGVGTSSVNSGLGTLSFVYQNYAFYRDSPLSASFLPNLPYPNFDARTPGDFVTSCVGCAYRSYSAVRNPTAGSTINTTASISSGAGLPGIRAVSPIVTTNSSVSSVAAPTSFQSIANNAITENEVVEYVSKSLPLFSVDHANPKVTRTRLLSSATIQSILKGEQTGKSADTQLWFVEIKGNFSYKGQKGTLHNGYEIFDPATGNLLMMGALG